MFEVRCYDKKNNKEFTRVFWDRKSYTNFINKCKYSKIILILCALDNSKYFD